MKKLLKISLTLIITAIFVTGIIMPEIILGSPASPAVGNWYQQYLPNLPNFQVSDMLFLDSLTGFIVTGNGSPNDSSGYILKTTDAGDNWTLKFAEYRDFSRIKFVNTTTGFVSGGYFNGARIYKTTNAGESWQPINIPGGGQIYFDDMSVLNENIIWVVASNSLVGGVFRTTNGGASWDTQVNLGSNNPEKIYMFNQRIGYISKNNGSSGYIRKTTDGGSTWNMFVNNDYYMNMKFTDSLTGWKNSAFGFKKTTNGGINWSLQTIPSGGIIINSFIYDFTVLNKDTLWGTGGYVMYPNGQTRGILYRTVDGGANWLFQIPDTSINMSYSFIRFIDKLHGWVYSNSTTGIHTILGGDPQFIMGITQLSINIPDSYELFQNYPNPFNPATNIKYQITNNRSYIKLIVYDITGREIIKLVDREQTAGTYNVDFAGSFLASGVYFYRIEAEETNGAKFTDCKKMVLLK